MQEEHIKYLMDSGRLVNHDDVQRESKRLANVWTDHTLCGIAGKMERAMKKRGLITFPDTRPWNRSISTSASLQNTDILLQYIIHHTDRNTPSVRNNPLLS